MKKERKGRGGGPVVYFGIDLASCVGVGGNEALVGYTYRRFFSFDALWVAWRDMFE